MVQRRDRMKSLNDVLRLPADEFFGYVRGIDYGYMDAEGVVHRISPADNCADQSGAPYRFSSPEQVVRNNCGWCWDIAELIRLWCERNSIEYKCVFLEYRSPELHRTHTQVFAKWNGKWCEAPDNTSPVLFGENGYDSAEACISAFTGLFRAYLEHELDEKYDEDRLLVKEFRNTVVSGLTDEEYLSIVRSN